MNVTQKGNDLAYPCGNTAKYMFNDEFKFIQGNDKRIEINDTFIAHYVDRTLRFKNNEKVLNEGGYWTNVEDEHLMVWYQMET